jgi:hypothetical protein
MSSRRGLRVLGALVAVLTLLAGTTAAGAVGPTRGKVFVQTAPALAGVRLLVGSTVVTTGRGGSAAIAVSNINGVASRVSLASKVLDARTGLSLAYVKPAPHTAKYESHLTVGLDVTSRVRLQISGGTTGVATGSVHAVRLHSVTGQTMLVDPQRTPTVNLLSRKTRLVAGVVTPQVVTWSVDSLRAAPGVSITTARAKFDPYSSSVWPLLLRAVHGTVIVETVPATPGVSFLLDGATFTTDAHGRGTSPVADLNGVDLRLRASTSQATGSTVAVLRVSRLKPAAPFQRHLVAALAVSRPVSLTFTDPAGQPVPSDRVSEVQLDGGGSTVKVTGAQLADPVSLLSARGKLVDGVVKPQQVTYSVTRVTLDGGNAVFAGQQRLNPNSASDWPISVSVFDVTVTARDVLFGSRVTSTAYVSRPDGGRSAVQLSRGRPTVLRSLVRGGYTLTTQAAVVGANTNILVSKNSDVELRVVTLLDAVVLVLLLIGMAVSVVLVGRRRRPGSRPTRSQL